MMTETKGSLPSDTNRGKGYYHHHVMEDKEVPNLDPITSYDSSSTTALSESTLSPSRSMTTTVTIPELLEETSMALRQVQWEEQLLAMAEDDTSLLSPDHTESQTQQYFSKQEFQTLLTPTFIECLEASTEEYNSRKQMQRLRRKELIQRELEAIIQTTAIAMANDDEEEGHEFEPEAVEALGIAANRVAYLKKYYDVTSCQYIYVPSVAYTILNGSLLEEASQHYFGKSEEFLITYAASLGTTVLQNGLPQVLPGQVLDYEDPDDDSKEDFLSHDSELGLEATAIKYWGVSPLSTAQSVMSSRNTFTFDSSATPNHSPCDCSTRPMMMNGLTPKEDGTWNEFDAAATASNARVDNGGSVHPMDSSTLEYSVTSHDSPAGSIIMGEVHDFSFDATVETKDVTAIHTTTVTSNGSLTGTMGSITPMIQATTCDSPGQSHIARRMDASIVDQDGTLDLPGTPKRSHVHGSASPTESPVEAPENTCPLTLDSSVKQESLSSSVQDSPMLQESPVDWSAKPNPLTMDTIAATSKRSIMTHDSTEIGSVTPPKDSTSPSPHKTPNVTLDSSLSVKSLTVDSSVLPEESTIHYSTSPKDLALHSTDQSLLLHYSNAAKNVTVDSSVVPDDLTLHGTFDESVKPYDSDSTCDVAAHDLKLDSSVAPFSSTLDSGLPKFGTNHSCDTPTRPKLDLTANDGASQGSVLSNKPTVDDAVPASAVPISFYDSPTAPKHATASGIDSTSCSEKKSSPRLFILLAIVLSLGIGAPLLLPSAVEQEQHLLLHQQPSSTWKVTSTLPVQNGQSLETATTLPREETCNKNSITNGQKERGTVATNSELATSSCPPNDKKKPTRTRPIVPNLWY